MPLGENQPSSSEFKVSRVERLVNLVALLSDTDRALSYEDIIMVLPGYEGAPVTARRAFERDKTTLREMGIDVRTEPLDPLAAKGPLNVGYRIAADELIPDPGLTEQERSALAVAVVLVWDDDTNAVAGTAGAEGDALGMTGIDTTHARVPPLASRLLDAVTRRRSVEFDYVSSDSLRRRSVEPYELVHRQGVWYLIGYDVDVRDKRTFRLDRIVGDVKLSAAGNFARPKTQSVPVPRHRWEIVHAEPIEARIAVRPERLWWVEQETGGVTDTTMSVAGETWPTLTLSVGDIEAFAAWVASQLGDVVAISPPEAAAAVCRRLDSVQKVLR